MALPTINCAHCGQPTQLLSFNKLYCSERCQRKAAEKRRRQVVRDAIAAYKVEHGCAHCPPGTPWPALALELHHRDPTTKLFKMSLADQWGRSAVTAELAKCEVLCAGHHRLIETAEADPQPRGSDTHSSSSL